MKDAATMAKKEEVIKANIRHNTEVRDWNRKAMLFNKKREACMDRQARNIDIEVIPSDEAGFVMANRPHQAVSSLPQNENIKNFLKVQNRWQYSFLKFPLRHKAPGKAREEDRELGESGVTFGSNASSSINVIPKTVLVRKKNHPSVDDMALKYKKWETLAFTNQMNGFPWYRHFPGQWWLGMERDEAFEKMATARQKQRAPVVNTLKADAQNLEKKIAIDKLTNHRRRVYISRRRFKYPRWYVRGEVDRRRRFNPVQPARRRTFVGFVDPGSKRVVKAALRVFKYGDDQRAMLKVKLSLCNWKRNTLSWDTSKTLTAIREDKYGHLKRMMFRENKVKLWLKSKDPKSPAEESVARSTTSLVQVDEGAEKFDRPWLHDFKPTQPNKRARQLGEAVKAREKVTARAKVKGLFDGTGYTNDFTKRTSKSAYGIVQKPVAEMDPKAVRPYNYEEVYRTRHVTTESTYPKELRPMPKDPTQVDEAWVNPNFNPVSMCHCVEPFFNPKKPLPTCRFFKSWAGHTYSSQICNTHRMDYVEEENQTPPVLSEICCQWYKIKATDVHIKYCNGEVSFRLKIHLPGNPKPVWREFTPPNKALMGSCNNYVRILALGFKYGGNAFKRELRFQAKRMKYVMRNKKYNLYKASHDYVRNMNTREVNQKVTTLDDEWRHRLVARDAQWESVGTYRYKAWQKYSKLLCYLPAAFPLFIPLFGPFIRIPLFVTRFCNDDCCWMWPLNGDCPICLLYGPDPGQMVMEAINFAIYLMYRDGYDTGCPPIEGWANCVGDGEITQGTDEDVEEYPADDTPPDEADDGFKFDDPKAPEEWVNGVPAEENLDKLSAPGGNAPKKGPAKGASSDSAEGYGDVKGDGDGDEGGDGEEHKTRDVQQQQLVDLGETISIEPTRHSASVRTTNHSSMKFKASLAIRGLRSGSPLTKRVPPEHVQQPPTTPLRNARVPKAIRSSPQWHMENVPWIVNRAVARENNKVDSWLGEVVKVQREHLRRQERMREWENMTPEQRKIAWHKLMSPARLETERKAKENGHKVEAMFSSTGVKPHYTKVHVQMNTHPFIRQHGPLPAGWHYGTTSKGVTYYWNDSGAKQLHLPVAPFIANFYKEANLKPDDLQAAIRKGLDDHLDLNGWDPIASNISSIVSDMPT